MLFLYRTQIIKVTDRMRRIVMGATLGIAVFYGISMLINLFGGERRRSSSRRRTSASASASSSPGSPRSTWRSTSTSSRRAPGRACPSTWSGSPRSGLLVTLVWLYLEILRLLAKLRER